MISLYCHENAKKFGTSDRHTVFPFVGKNLKRNDIIELYNTDEIFRKTIRSKAVSVNMSDSQLLYDFSLWVYSYNMKPPHTTIAQKRKEYSIILPKAMSKTLDSARKGSTEYANESDNETTDSLNLMLKSEDYIRENFKTYITLLSDILYTTEMYSTSCLANKAAYKNPIAILYSMWMSLFSDSEWPIKYPELSAINADSSIANITERKKIFSEDGTGEASSPVITKFIDSFSDYYCEAKGLQEDKYQIFYNLFILFRDDEELNIFDLHKKEGLNNGISREQIEYLISKTIQKRIFPADLFKPDFVENSLTFKDWRKCLSLQEDSIYVQELPMMSVDVMPSGDLMEHISGHFNVLRNIKYTKYKVKMSSGKEHDLLSSIIANKKNWKYSSYNIYLSDKEIDREVETWSQLVYDGDSDVFNTGTLSGELQVLQDKDGTPLLDVITPDKQAVEKLIDEKISAKINYIYLSIIAQNKGVGANKFTTPFFTKDIIFSPDPRIEAIIKLMRQRRYINGILYFMNHPFTLKVEVPYLSTMRATIETNRDDRLVKLSTFGVLENGMLYDRNNIYKVIYVPQGGNTGIVTEDGRFYVDDSNIISRRM